MEAAPAPSQEQVIALQSEVVELVKEMAALETEVAAAQTEAEAAHAAMSEADAAARSAEEMASQARAEAEQAQAEIDVLVAAAAKSQEMMEAAEAKAEMAMAAAHQPAAVMVSADQLDASLLHFDSARASLAGPDSIYLSSIIYDGRPFSALLKYRGGTTATVEQVFGASGKLIPDAVGLSRTTLALVGADLLDISYVELNGQGYSGQLRYAGDNRMEVAGIQRVMLPPTAMEQVAAAEAAASAATAAAQAAADAAVADAQATAVAAIAEAQAAAEAAVADARAAAVADAQATAVAAIAEAQAAAEAAVADARAAADAASREAQAAAAEAQAKVDMMMAEPPPPAAVMVSADRLDTSLLSLDSAQASLAGPDLIYVTSIMYDGQSYSALLRYQGGTTATVKQIFGPTGKLIPDSVSLAQTELSFVAPDVLDIAGVELDGQGYSGQLQYTGDNRLEVVGIQRVTLPPSAMEQVSAAAAGAAAAVADAQAATDAAMSEAQTAQAAAEAAVSAAQAEAEAARAATAAAADAATHARAQVAALQLELDLQNRLVVPEELDMRLLNLDSAQVSRAGPRSLYISRIGYGDGEFSARLRYTGRNAGVTEALFDAMDGALPDLDLSAPAVEAIARDTLVISNVGIGGTAFALSFRARPDGAIVITQQDQGHRVRTSAELLRHELLISPAVDRIVSGFGGGSGLPDEGTWTTAGAQGVSQVDAEATHAKFAIRNVAQPEAVTLYGVTARAGGGKKLGYGLHFLASATPRSGNTWNFGQSYLLWVTQEVNFYDTDQAHVQLYESLDGNRLMWLNSTKIPRSMSSDLTLEALYQPGDCPMTMRPGSCHGSITVLVDGTEQFKVAVSSDFAARVPDTIALRSLHGPVEFLDLYVYARR